MRYASLCSGIEAASMAAPVMRFIGKRIQHEITDSTNP